MLLKNVFSYKKTTSTMVDIDNRCASSSKKIKAFLLFRDCSFTERNKQQQPITCNNSNSHVLQHYKKQLPMTSNITNSYATACSTTESDNPRPATSQIVTLRLAVLQKATTHDLQHHQQQRCTASSTTISKTPRPAA